MIAVLILTLAAIACIGSLIIVNKPGEKDELCDYENIEK